jgi:ABC-type multidrug transport system permease subunit
MILTLILKNLKIIFRSPLTILLVVLAPIILMLLVGISFSGNTLSNTAVGLVNGPDKNIFDYGDEIKFVRYLDNDLGEAFKKCKVALKQGTVELCLHYKTNYGSDGRMTSANVIYLVDDTRYQITDILLNVFDKSLEKLTKQISTNSIENVFTKANETLVLMEDSIGLIQNLSRDVDSALMVLSQLDLYLNQANSEYSTIYRELGFVRSEVNSKVKNLESSKRSLDNSIASFEGTIEDLDDELSGSINLLEDTYSALYALSLVDPLVAEEVDLDEIEESIDKLSSVQKELGNMDNDLNLLSNNLDLLDSFSDFSDLIDENYNQLGKFKGELLIASRNVKSVIVDVKGKQEQIRDVEKVVTEKVEYFSDLLARDVSDITEPISRTVYSTHENLEKIHQLAPSVVMIILLFIGLLLSNIIVSLEINSKAYFRNVISPISQSEFIFALFFTSLIIILAQLFFLFLVLIYFFSIPVFANFFSLMFVVVHVLVVFILIGILLAYLFSSLQVSILVTTFVMLFFFLLSNTIISIEIMPSFFSNMVLLNPIVIGEDLIRKIFYHSSLPYIDYTGIMFLYFYYVVLIFLIAIVSRRRQENSF